MSDLSRALVDAAAEADWQAHNAAVLKVIGKRGGLDEKRRAISRARSRAAVAAVLETLAASKTAEINKCRIKPAEDCGRCHRLSNQVAELRGLAAEVKAVDGDG